MSQLKSAETGPVYSIKLRQQRSFRQTPIDLIILAFSGLILLLNSFERFMQLFVSDGKFLFDLVVSLLDQL
jgi:hypothetical protein